VYQKEVLELFNNDKYKEDEDKRLLPHSFEGTKIFELLEEMAFSRNKKYLEEFLTTVPVLFDRFMDKRKEARDRTADLADGTYKLKGETLDRCEAFVAHLLSVEDTEKKRAIRNKFLKEFEQCFPSNHYSK
jgi:hypothetical protein